MVEEGHTKCLLPNHTQLLLRKGQRSQSSGRATSGEKKAQEMYVKFIENQDALEKENQEVERLRCGYDDLDTWVKEKIERMRYKILEDKGRLGEGFFQNGVFTHYYKNVDMLYSLQREI